MKPQNGLLAVAFVNDLLWSDLKIEGQTLHRADRLVKPTGE